MTRSTVPIDQTLVRRLRAQVADRLNQQRRSDEVAGRVPMSAEDERQFARSLIVQVLEDHARTELSDGRQPPTPDEEEAAAAAIHAALFGVGRLQPLLDDPEVENIDINGADRVFVGYADGREELHEPVADSDEELIELIQVLAANVGLTSRPFDSANPQLDLRLPDGSRLSAVMGVCSRPAVSVRRSRLGKVTLDDLIGTGTMTADVANFLRAAVRARKNLIISGATNSGKALALDTPVPTPDGWTRMGDIRRGDLVFDETGAPSRVLEAHDVLHDRDCYAVTFDDGEVIIADGDHLWAVTTRTDRENTRARELHRARVGPELASLRATVEAIQAQSDRSVTIAEATEVLGQKHRALLFTIAAFLPVTGRATSSFTRIHYGREQTLARPASTYSLHALTEELLVRRTRRHKRAEGPPWQVVRTAYMAGRLKRGQYWNFRVPVARPLQYQPTEQPIDPYVLGIWLGDGTTAAAQVTTADREVVEALERAGYPCRLHTPRDPYRYAVAGDLQPKLRAVGVLGDKHIPRIYLRASLDQRRALLQGLMDSDGTVSPNGELQFSSSLEILAEQVRELVTGLGYKARVRRRQITFAGRLVAPTFTVAWTTGEPCFRLEHKRRAQEERARTSTIAEFRRSARTIVAIEPCPSVPVRCLTVDSKSHLYLVGRGAIPTHNTTLLRAMAAEIPAQERLITVERALEMGLDAFDDIHPNVVAFEERLPNSEGLGGVTMAELVRRSLRMNPSRVIVGEVLGDEIVTMLNAMSQGNDGSLSTIHANSSLEVFNRLATYALQAEENLPVEATHMLIAGSINFVVFMRKVNTYQEGGGLHRVIESVREVTGVDGRVLSSEVFAPGPDGLATAHAPINCLDDLEEQGYHPPLRDRW